MKTRITYLLIGLLAFTSWLSTGCEQPEPAPAPPEEQPAPAPSPEPAPTNP